MPEAPSARPAVEQNVASRKAANELVELGVSLAREYNLDNAHIRLFWQHVMEISAQLINDQVLCDVCKKAIQNGTLAARNRSTDGNRWRNPQDRGKRFNDHDLMPFGKFKDQPLGNVPPDYLDWLATQPWIEKWPALLEYIETGQD